MMQNHKYRVGQRVNFTGPVRNNSPSGEYEILRVLPSNGGELLYRIKSRHETYERVVAEDQLSSRGAAGFLSN
jgi:hypothetical protein